MGAPDSKAQNQIMRGRKAAGKSTVDDRGEQERKENTLERLKRAQFLEPAMAMFRMARSVQSCDVAQPPSLNGFTSCSRKRFSVAGWQVLNTHERIGAAGCDADRSTAVSPNASNK